MDGLCKQRAFKPTDCSCGTISGSAAIWTDSEEDNREHENYKTMDEDNNMLEDENNMLDKDNNTMGIDDNMMIDEDNNMMDWDNNMVDDEGDE